MAKFKRSELLEQGFATRQPRTFPVLLLTDEKPTYCPWTIEPRGGCTYQPFYCWSLLWGGFRKATSSSLSLLTPSSIRFSQLLTIMLSSLKLPSYGYLPISDPYWALWHSTYKRKTKHLFRQNTIHYYSANWYKSVKNYARCILQYQSINYVYGRAFVVLKTYPHCR